MIWSPKSKSCPPPYSFGFLCWIFYIFMSWLTGSFKAFVNKLFKENFDTIFILKKM